MKTKNLIVFKTNIQNTEQATKLQALAGLTGITDWSTDLEDCDNILRVQGRGIRSDQIIRLMDELGFSCEELAYDEII